MLNGAVLCEGGIVQKKIWKCGIFFVSLGGRRDHYLGDEIRFGYVAKISYICISQILYL